ncbi:STAS domain-containing protein [Allokutzneria sp. A3M-2-11 16]|uniref:STAS domain-containing protein n=1 Tax=Allokutzneria sp. A3M-2-11 16 TaxID=2962043 RepID=UPI0020B8286B|nr:STAS domain-containing protein [Allokutzneria sp. A3M-2-11 16]MCP3803109.1 STAS domain-containing protein [Allokutzneria sp. A3M-2-11 16]
MRGVIGLEVSRSQIGGAAVLTIGGEIDLDTAPSLHEAVTACRDEVCVVDLTEVTFLGSAGLTALLDATVRARARRASLRIVVDGNHAVIRPIEITGLDRELALFHSVDEALQARSFR